MKEHLDVLVGGARRLPGGTPAGARAPAIAGFLRRALDTLVVYELSQRKRDGYDIGTHFTPRYKPWDQRFCIVPGGDLFKAISAGSASIVTETYRAFEIPLSGAMAFS